MINCPISLEKANIPVVTDDGITYDFYNLAMHILTTGPSDPMTRMPITNITLLRGLDISAENINIDETCNAFMSLVNSYPYLKVRGVGELSFLKRHIAPVNNFLQSLRIHSFEPNITLFHLAAHLNNLECMKTLYQEGIADVNQGYKDNITALHLACAVANINVVEWLLSLEDIDVNACQDSSNVTALHIAASICNVKIVALLAKHPDINIPRPRLDGFTVFEYAIHYEHVKILNILLMCSNTPNAGILYAEERKNDKLVNMFLEYYLHEMLHRPSQMQKYLEQHPEVESCLKRHHATLWELLIKPSNSLNLTHIFPHPYEEHSFDKEKYFDFIRNELELVKNKDKPSNPLFSLFTPKIDFTFKWFEQSNPLKEKIDYCAQEKSNIKHSHSMPSLSQHKMSK
jgi:Ankyrin repeats (many copies)/U-box domain